MFPLPKLKQIFFILVLISIFVKKNVECAAIDSSKEVCVSPECVLAASSILKNLDASVDPCDDFYRFACGKFLKEAVIPDEKPDVNIFSELSDELESQLRISFEEDMNDNDPRTFKLIRTLYKTCMDEEQIEKTGEKDLLEIVEKLGGWPVLNSNSWDVSNSDWTTITYKLRELGLKTDSLIQVSVEPNLKNSSQHVIVVDQGETRIYTNYLQEGFQNEIVQAYFKYLTVIAVLLGADPVNAETQILEALNFEMELAKVSLLPEQRLDLVALYNSMTIQDLESKYPSVPWTEFINKLLAPYVEVDTTEEVIVPVPSYFEALEKLLAKTPKRVIVNYIMGNVVTRLVAYAGKRFDKVRAEFRAALLGTPVVKRPRWKECVDTSQRALSIAADSVYARRYFDKKAKAEATEVIQDLVKSFETLLEKADWMDEETKSKALHKLNRIKMNIAYQEELMDDFKLDEYHRDLDIDNSSYLKNKLNVDLFDTNEHFSKLREPVNKGDWTQNSAVAIINAFYNPIENSVILPAGILQSYFFGKDRPSYMNYGAIGFVMGHELTHGFDDFGRTIDVDGNLINWWQPETKQKYVERAECILNQYSNFTVEEVQMKLNGKLTLSENIADNGGIKEAYQAYNEWVKRHGQEPPLPGLEYSSRQLFWISAANVWCHKERKEALKRSIVQDHHSPGEFRILGAFSNAPEFARDFNCPDGSRMNPVNKCSVW